MVEEKPRAKARDRQAPPLVPLDTMTLVPEESSLITALILDRPLCIDCIGTKATLIPAAVESYLAIMSRVLRIDRAEGECSSCGATTLVVSCSLFVPPRSPDASP